MKLPHLSPTAKAQLWGMTVGGSTAFLATYRSDYGLGLFLIGWLGAWVAGEFLFGGRLIAQSDLKAIAIAVVSGIAFPWIGFAIAALTHR